MCMCVHMVAHAVSYNPLLDLTFMAPAVMLHKHTRVSSNFPPSFLH